MSEKKEPKLNKSEQLYKTLAESANDVITMVNKNYEVVFANNYAASLVGGSPEKLIGQSLKKIFPKEIYDLQKQNIDIALKNGKIISSQKHFIFHGQKIWLDTRIFPVIEPDGSIENVVITSRDISPLKKTETELQKAKDKLEKRVKKRTANIKQYVNELAESEARFSKAFEAGPLGIVLVSVDRRIINVNSMYCRMTGYSKKELLNKELVDIIYPEDIPKSVEAAKELFTGKKSIVKIEKRYVKKNGEIIWVNLISSIIRDEKGEVLYALSMIEDITERKKIEEALKESEEKYHSLVNNLNIGVYRNTGGPQGRFIEANPAIVKMFGYETVEEFMKVPVSKLYQHPRNRKFYVAEIANAGSLKNRELLLKKKDGKKMVCSLTARAHFNNQGKIEWTDGVIEDITEQKKAEESFKRSEEKYRTLTENIQDGVFVIQDRKYKYINKSQAKILGYGKEEIIGSNFLKYIVSEEKDLVAERYRLLLAGKKIPEAEIRTQKKDGTLRIVQPRVGAIIYEGKPAVIGTMRDVTVAKQVQQLGEALNSINLAISSTLDFDKIMQRVIIDSAKAVGSESAAIFLREEDQWVVKHVFQLPEQYIGLRLGDDEAINMANAVRSGKTVVVNDTSKDKRVDKRLVKKYNLKSYMANPLILKKRVSGMLFFSYQSKPVRFGRSQTDFVNKVAVSISLALENSRLYTKERHVADTLQEALLTKPKKIPGIEFGYLYRSAVPDIARVGGDFYDLFKIGKDKVGIIVGDISGKGIEAANLTSLVKSTIRAYAYLDENPALVIERTNKVVEKATDSWTFATVFFGILDILTGKLTYCSAGHPMAILKKGSETESLCVGSVLIGVFKNRKFVNGRATLAAGDVLVLYSDGVTEARRDLEFYGDERLADFVKNLKLQANQFAQAIFNDVVRFSDGKLLDDVVLLTVSLKNKKSRSLKLSS